MIEYRWAEGHYDRLPALAVDLVRRQVAVIFTSGGAPPLRAAMGTTTTIPIIFNVGDDPVSKGYVASLNRPGSNVTGVNFLATEVAAKRLELLRERSARYALLRFRAVFSCPRRPRQARRGKLAAASSPRQARRGKLHA